MSINPNTQYTLSGSQITDLKTYVKAAMESPSVLLGTSDPTSSTAGEVGILYYNKTSGEPFVCTAKTAQGTTPETYTYTWASLLASTVSALNAINNGGGN